MMELRQHRVGYALVKTLLLVVVLALPRAPLRHREPSIAVVGVVVALTSLAFVLLQSSDPGYLTEELVKEASQGGDIDDDGLVLTTEEEDDEESEDQLRSPTKQAEKTYRLRRIQQIQAALQRSSRQAEKPTQEEEDEDDFDRGIDEMQRKLEQQPLTYQHDIDAGEAVDAFCVECSLFPPLRSHHCRDCGRCVATFDHHCFLLGTCIGERNHMRFWWFLLFQSIELLLGVLIITARFQPPRPKSSWTHANGWPLFLLFDIVLLLVLVGSMLAFHTFLAMGSMTTYEFGRGSDKIAYLRGFRECDLPFSRGLVTNLVYFCCPQRRERPANIPWLPTMWKPPAPIVDRNSDKICENLWENKYYSCC